MTTIAAGSRAGMTAEERKVIFASSLGTVFEWYDFNIYGTLAVFFGKLFFPPGNETAGFLSSLALFGGFDRSFTLQPLSIEMQSGFALAAGVASLSLRTAH